MAALLGLLVSFCAAQDAPSAPAAQTTQNPSAITLDTSETIFSVLTALNSCGYDEDLTISDASRINIRAEVQRNLKESDEAQVALTTMCDYYQNHLAGKNTMRSLSQYVSLALYMEGPPHFLPRVKEEEMPPDAAQVAGFGAVLEHFYDKAELHAIWERHHNDYAALVDRYHQPLAKMVFDTEIYLKLASSQYLGARSPSISISWGRPAKPTRATTARTMTWWCSLLRAGQAR